MDSGNEWSEVDAGEEHLHTVWEHEQTGDRIKVAEFEDDTWDTFLNDRLISNHDEPREAVERAHELRQNFSVD